MGSVNKYSKNIIQRLINAQLWALMQTSKKKKNTHVNDSLTYTDKLLFFKCSINII